MSYLQGKKGGFDPHARIPDMDLDGIDAAFLYPSVGLFSGAYDRGSRLIGMIEERLGETATFDFFRIVYRKYYFRPKYFVKAAKKMIRSSDERRRLLREAGEFLSTMRKRRGDARLRGRAPGK